MADCLKPEGRAFFADDAYRTPDELVEGPSSSTIRWQIPDGTAYRLVEAAHQPGDLERRLRELGWDIKVTTTAGPFYWEREAGVSTPHERARRVPVTRVTHGATSSVLDLWATSTGVVYGVPDRL